MADQTQNTNVAARIDRLSDWRRRVYLVTGLIFLAGGLGGLFAPLGWFAWAGGAFAIGLAFAVGLGVLHGLAGRHAGAYEDEVFRKDMRDAQSNAFWVYVGLIPLFGVLAWLGVLDEDVGVGVVRAFAATAFLGPASAFVIFAWRNRG